MLKVRQPNDDEIMELVEYLRNDRAFFERDPDDEMDDIRNLIETSMISVCENYIPDSPGYTGKIMTIVWPGSPSSYEAFLFRDEKMVHINQDRSFFQIQRRRPF